MSSHKICDYCGEYQHDCQCKAAKAIAKLNGKYNAALQGWHESDVEINKLHSRITDLERVGGELASCLKHWHNHQEIQPDDDMEALTEWQQLKGKTSHK